MDDICENRHGGNNESREAFQTTPASRRSEQCATITDYVRSCGSTGSTCEEAEEALSMHRSSCSARFSELKAAGVLIRTAMQRRTRSGKNARAWGVSPFFTTHDWS
jgi:hypothetical protein